MNQYEIADAIEEIASMERRRGRLLAHARALEGTDPSQAELYYEWADTTADEIGRRERDLAIEHYRDTIEAQARGEYPA